MLAKNFFQGMFNLPISPEMINTALFKYGVGPDMEMYLIDGRDQDLILADILIMLSRASQGYTNMSGSDHFSMTIKGEMIPLNDRKAMRAEAVALYRKHGIELDLPLMSAINI